MITVKKIGTFLLAACLVFPSYAVAKKSDEDHQSKSVARKLKEEKKKQKKSLKKIEKKQKKELKKQNKLLKKQERKLKKEEKKNKTLPRPLPAQPNPPVVEAPKVYMVNVKDLSKEQKRRAEKLFNQKYDKKGIIKFSHSGLTNPNFKEFLDLKESEKKARNPGVTVQTYEYISSKQVSHKRKKEDSKKKKKGHLTKERYKWRQERIKNFLGLKVME